MGLVSPAQHAVCDARWVQLDLVHGQHTTRTHGTSGGVCGWWFPCLSSSMMKPTSSYQCRAKQIYQYPLKKEASRQGFRLKARSASVLELCCYVYLLCMVIICEIGAYIHTFQLQFLLPMLTVLPTASELKGEKVLVKAVLLLLSQSHPSSPP